MQTLRTRPAHDLLQANLCKRQRDSAPEVEGRKRSNYVRQGPSNHGRINILQLPYYTAKLWYWKKKTKTEQEATNTAGEEDNRENDAALMHVTLRSSNQDENFPKIPTAPLGTHDGVDDGGLTLAGQRTFQIRVIETDVEVPVKTQRIAIMADTSGSMGEPLKISETILKKRERFPEEYEEYEKECASVMTTVEEASRTPRLDYQYKLCRKLEWTLDPNLRYHFRSEAFNKPGNDFFDMEVEKEQSTDVSDCFSKVYEDMGEGAVVPLLVLTDEKLRGVTLDGHFNAAGIQRLFFAMSFTSYDPFAEFKTGTHSYGDDSSDEEEKRELILANNRRYTKRVGVGGNSVEITDPRAVPDFSAMVTSQGKDMYRIDRPGVDMDSLVGRFQQEVEALAHMKWMVVENEYDTGLVLRGGGVTTLIPPRSKVTVPQVPEGIVQLFVDHAAPAAPVRRKPGRH